ncbi:MAG: hypothetical protein Q8K33_08730 [Cypionkella sp.]|uniref:hypothetical protein n=1 Tax=Cypionkella sp. TaxID=2811411 RepID=UPI002731BB4F|nr:hypothetical protein [Cypionkella sp.]MDP2048958.1 hypothetical protein [Cypionkella sp.]
MAHAFLNGLGAQGRRRLRPADGALAMITPGDNAMTSLAEVKALSGSRAAAAIR